MTHASGKTLLLGIIIALSFMITGCFLRGQAVFIFQDEDGTFRATYSTVVPNAGCTRDGAIITCIFAFLNDEDQIELEEVIIVLPGPAQLLLLFVDPMVIQFPDDVSDFSGTFLHQDSGTSGDLVINAGLSSIAADIDRTLSAEPGNQLVIIDLPDGAPTEGDFAYNFNFTLPAGTTSLSIKPIFTGRVTLDGQIFYPPLLPCVTDFAAAPEIIIPIAPGDQMFDIPSIAGRGCDNVNYNFGGTAGSVPTAIPTLTQWGVVLLSGLLCLSVYYWRRIS